MSCDMNYEVLSLMRSCAQARGALETVEEGMYNKVRALFCAVEDDKITAREASDSMNEDLRRVREILEKSEESCMDSMMSCLNQPYQSCPELTEEISVLQTKNMELVNELNWCCFIPDEEMPPKPEEKLEEALEYLFKACIPLCQIRYSKAFMEFESVSAPLSRYDDMEICTEINVLEDKVRYLWESDKDLEMIMRRAAGNAYVDNLRINDDTYES